jgi:hypothetical protein
VKRRSFITLLGGAASWPFAARTQQGERIRRVGALILGNADADAFRNELREGLSKAGYVEGRNVQVDIRSAQGRLELLPRLAAELVAAKVDALHTVCARRTGGNARYSHCCDRRQPCRNRIYLKSSAPGREYHGCLLNGGRGAWKMCGSIC